MDRIEKVDLKNNLCDTGANGDTGSHKDRKDPLPAKLK
jgi:hypothetical protein